MTIVSKEFVFRVRLVVWGQTPRIHKNQYFGLLLKIKVGRNHPPERNDRNFNLYKYLQKKQWNLKEFDFYRTTRNQRR